MCSQKSRYEHTSGGFNAQYLALIWLFYLVKFREVHKTTSAIEYVCLYV